MFNVKSLVKCLNQRGSIVGYCVPFFDPSGMLLCYVASIVFSLSLITPAFMSIYKAHNDRLQRLALPSHCPR